MQAMIELFFFLVAQAQTEPESLPDPHRRRVGIYTDSQYICGLLRGCFIARENLTMAALPTHLWKYVKTIIKHELDGFKAITAVWAMKGPTL